MSSPVAYASDDSYPHVFQRPLRLIRVSASASSVQLVVKLRARRNASARSGSSAGSRSASANDASVFVRCIANALLPSPEARSGALYIGRKHWAGLPWASFQEPFGAGGPKRQTRGEAMQLDGAANEGIAAANAKAGKGRGKLARHRVLRRLPTPRDFLLTIPLDKALRNLFLGTGQCGHGSGSGPRDAHDQREVATLLEDGRPGARDARNAAPALGRQHQRQRYGAIGEFELIERAQPAARRSRRRDPELEPDSLFCLAA